MEEIECHDVTYKHAKPIVCEDVKGHIEYAIETFPNISILKILGSWVFCLVVLGFIGVIM